MRKYKGHDIYPADFNSSGIRWYCRTDRMREMYTVKTRNWNGNKLAAKMLRLTLRFGVSRCGDGLDDKFYLSTENALKAWIVWLCFMSVRHLSGGWTYIVRPGHDLGGGYLAIY